MPNFSEQLNYDFIERYQALDATLAPEGVIGYLIAMENAPWYEKRRFAAFEDELSAIKRMRLLYSRLTKTANLSESIADEDDVDYLDDLIRRLEAGYDPLTRLATEIPDESNADAKKNRAIESSAREISSRSIAWQEALKKIALTSAACLAVGISVLWRIKKGLHL